MAKRKKQKAKPLTFVEKMLLMKKAGFTHGGASYETEPAAEDQPLADLPERVRNVLQIVSNNPLKPSKMLYFIMYDISDNKVRSAVAKYLEEKSCLRVQKSIFFADTERAVFNQIWSDLKAIQELYENEDSIFLVPVSTDQLRSMKIIGQNDAFDLVLGNQNTIFF